VRVEHDAALQPRRTWYGAGHHEYVSHVALLGRAVAVVAPAHALEMVPSLERGNLGVRSQLDRGVALDTANEISRHALGQAAGPDDHVDARRRLCEEHRRLASRIAAAYYDDLLAATQLRLHERGTVVDARTLELREIRQR
jgi:hypothetical protein